MDSSLKLQKLIKSSVNNHNLEELNLYFDHEPDTSEAFNDATISILFKMLKTNEKHENKSLQVTCVLSCIQHFVGLNLDSSKWLSMAENVAKLCELTFALSANYIKDDGLVQRNVDCIFELLDCDSQSRTVADKLLRYMLEILLKTALASSYHLKLSILGLTAAILLKSSRSLRLEIIPSITVYLEKLSNLLLVTGDYETQVAIVEVLARCWTYIKESGPITTLFSDIPDIHQLFNNYSFLNFDPECRLFLNEMNKYMGEKQLIYSIPCLVVSTDNKCLKKPRDVMYNEFWVDFNLSSRSISFYHQPIDAKEWELLKIEERLVFHASSSNSMCKGKHGNVIQTVKIEIKLKPDIDLPELPKIVKLYPRRIPEFFIVEKCAIQKILGEKYESEAHYDNISPSQKQIKSSEAPMCEQGSFMEANTIPHSKISEENSLDMISPSPSPRITTQQVKGEQGKVNKSTDYVKDTSAVINVEMDLTSRNKYTAQEMSLGNELARPCATNNSIKLNSPVPVTDSTITHRNNDCSSSDKVRSSRKRRLFSDEHNNTKDLVLSSQEDFSVKVPDYRLSKKESKDHRVNPATNVNRKHISYSYIREKEKESYSDKAGNLYSNLLSDDEVQSELLKKKKEKKNDSLQINNNYKYFKSSENDEKKLRDLNKTPESVKRSNIFAAQTVYSDLSPLASNSVVKKTYGRNKPKRGRRKAELLVESSDDNDSVPATQDLSDADSDYVPPPNKHVPAQYVGRKTATRKNKNVNTTFVDRLEDRKIDQIRDISYNDDMEVEMIDLKKPQIAVREVKIPSPINDTKPQKSRKRKGAIAGKMEVKTKISNKRGKTVSQSRKAKETTEILGSVVMTSTFRDHLEIINGLDRIPPPPPALEIVNYDPSVINDDELEDDEFNKSSLNTIAENKTMLQSTFKFNEMMQFGKTCLTQASNEIFRAQSLHQKERAMNYATFDFKVHSSISAIQNQGEKLTAMNNKLLEVKSLLEQTFTIQKEIAVGIQNETVQLNEARQALMSDMNKIEKTESSQIRGIVQGITKVMRNLVFSFIGNRNNKKALPN